MPLTYEERIKLLEKARAAKAAKRAGLTQNKEQEPTPEQEPESAPVEKPKKSRSKSVKPPTRTLELPPEPAPMSDEEPEIEERIVYRPKTQKKKKIIRTIIKDASDDEDNEEEVHETIEVPPKNKTSKTTVELPKFCPSKTNFFCY
jgi:Tfp pilus assembly protein FimV